MRILASLSIMALMLAGCTGGGDEQPAELTQEDCDPQGQQLGVENGTKVCRDVPVRVEILEAPSNLTAYGTGDVQWRIDPGNFAHRQNTTPHSMRNEVRASTERVDDAALGGPDSYGESLGRENHKDIPDGKTFTATWNPTEAGTYYLRAYGEVGAQDVWSDELVVEVGPVQPTETVETVTVQQLAAVQGVDPQDAAIGLGDGIQFQNEDVQEYTFTFTGPADVDAVTVAAGEASEVRHFLVPGTYQYQGGLEEEPIQGSVTVSQ